MEHETIRESTLEKLAKVKELIQSGMTMVEACQKVHTSPVTYRKHMQKESGQPPPAPRDVTPKYIDLPPTPKESGFVIVCSANNLKSVLEQLK